MLKSTRQIDQLLYLTMLFAAGMILPVVLIVVIHFTGYSILFEELAKCLVVLFIISRLRGRKDQLLGAAIFGFCFALSETGFYAGQLFTNGAFNVIGHRLLWTASLHMLTVLIMVAVMRKNRPALLLGLLLAIGIHWWFNAYLAIAV